MTCAVIQMKAKNEIKMNDIYFSECTEMCIFLGPSCLFYLDRELAIDFHRHLSFAVQRKRSVIMYSQLSVRKCKTGHSFFWNIYYIIKTKV